MSTLRPMRMSLAALAASLLLNVILVSCANEVTGPMENESEILARLDAVMARLNAIEEKQDQHAQTFATRIDSLQVRLTSVGSVPAPPLQAAQIDSILALASYIATDASTGGWEFCGGVQIGVKGSGLTKGGAEGKARGSLGAWAGTGGFAGADVTLAREYSLELGIEVPFAVNGCIPLGGEAPPTRVRMASRAAATSANLESTLSGIASQFGITQGRAETSLNTLATAFQSPASLRLQDATNLLPLPAGLSALLNDPTGALSSEIPARLDDALGLLCDRSWGARIATPLNTACARITSNSLDIGGLFSVVDQFPLVQNTLNDVTAAVSTVCSRVNGIGTKSLTIPNPLTIGPTNLFGPERLFPAYTTIGC